MVKYPNSNEVADFEAISARNRLSIAYFGLNQDMFLHFFRLKIIINPILGFLCVYKTNLSTPN
jgi:hypothetical protein